MSFLKIILLLLHVRFIQAAASDNHENLQREAASNLVPEHIVHNNKVVNTPTILLAPNSIDTATTSPSLPPTLKPSLMPVLKTSNPTAAPTEKPSKKPTPLPTPRPTHTLKPTGTPRSNPTKKPAGFPTARPSASPTQKPLMSASSMQPAFHNFPTTKSQMPAPPSELKGSALPTSSSSDSVRTQRPSMMATTIDKSPSPTSKATESASAWGPDTSPSKASKAPSSSPTELKSSPSISGSNSPFQSNSGSASPTEKSSPSFTVVPTLQSSSISTRIYYSHTVYDSLNFFDGFDFETFDDYTHGTVDYVTRAAAMTNKLINNKNGKIYIGVDNTTIVGADVRGRKSVRITSKRVLNGNNLVLLDLDHMPSTVGAVLPSGCSVWPAFWTVGPNWPNGGEVDVIEYINKDTRTNTALHTSPGCDMINVPLSSFNGSWTKSGISGGKISQTNCYGTVTGQDSNAGCSLIGPKSSVGFAFNNRTFSPGNIIVDSSKKSSKGGLYAFLWDKNKEFRTYYFPRNNIPLDLVRKQPKPESWGLPYGRFLINTTDCSSSHFKEHRIVIDTTLCGDWAGNMFPSTCTTKMTCSSFVRNYPSEFTQAYWLINSLEIYDFNMTNKSIL